MIYFYWEYNLLSLVCNNFFYNPYTAPYMDHLNSVYGVFLNLRIQRVKCGGSVYGALFDDRCCGNFWWILKVPHTLLFHYEEKILPHPFVTVRSSPVLEWNRTPSSASLKSCQSPISGHDPPHSSGAYFAFNVAYLIFCVCPFRYMIGVPELV